MRIAPAILVALALTACHGSTAALADLVGVSSDEPASGKAAHPPVGVDPGHVGRGTPLVPRDGDALAAFAEGCFWGSEDGFRQVPGVVATAVGFTGGHTDDPTYEKVCTHTTGHAETVLVEFDPKKISYDKLVEIFFATHDPTTKDRQGPDVGDQYRSAIYTFSTEQNAIAHAAAKAESASLGKEVTTEIAPIGRFWKAEEYHQQYDEKTGTHSCPLPSRFKKAT